MNVKEAIAYLESTDLKSLAPGRYDVDEDFYYLIQEYNTLPVSECKMESHDKWIDIQLIVSGKESLKTVDVSRLTVKVPYSAEKDVTFFETPEIMQDNVLTAGGYLVLYPENGHMPKCAVDEPVAVKKCVGKIRIK